MNVYHEHSSTLVPLKGPINKEVILITLYKIRFSPAVKKTAWREELTLSITPLQSG